MPRGSAPSQQAPPTGSGTATIAVPDGAKPGDLVQAKLPDGTVIQAAVPEGKKPGSKFTAMYTKEAPRSAPAPIQTLNCDPVSGMKWSLLGKVFVALLIISVLSAYLDAVRDETVDLSKWIAHQIRLHVIFATVVLVIFLRDVAELGPTVALQQCAIAGVTSFAIAAIVGKFLPELSFVVLLTVSLVLWVFLVLLLNIFGFVIGLVLVLAVFFIGGSVTEIANSAWMSSGDLGVCLTFVLFFGLFRYTIGIVPGVRSASTWHYTVSVTKGSDEFRQQEAIFQNACSAFAHKYPFRLELLRLFRIERPADKAAPPVCPDVPARFLFHGTSWEAAHAIVCDGFRLPTVSGMFGKGIYFADCPLKSWRYCFATKQLSQSIPRVLGRGGLILGTWVELGKVREERQADTGLTGYDRSSWRGWFVGHRHAYDSVRGVEEEQGGSLKAPEFVIYNPDQARVAYIFEVQAKY